MWLTITCHHIKFFFDYSMNLNIFPFRLSVLRESQALLKAHHAYHSGWEIKGESFINFLLLTVKKKCRVND